MKNTVFFFLFMLLAGCAKQVGLEAKLEGNVGLVGVRGQDLPDHPAIRVDARENLLNKGVSATATTNKYGFYKLDDLWSGRYEVTFSVEGFGKFTQDIDLLGGDEATFLNIQLYQIPDRVFTSCLLSVENDIINLSYESYPEIKGNYKIHVFYTLSKDPVYDPDQTYKRITLGDAWILDNDVILNWPSISVNSIRENYFPEGGPVYITLCISNQMEYTTQKIISSLIPISNTLLLNL